MLNPRISSVMEQYEDFDRVPPDVLKAAQERGTEIHAVNTAYALRVPWLKPIPEGYQGYITSFKKWFDSQVIDVVLAETRMEHPFGYNGKVDLVLTMRTEGLVVVDQKTPLAFHKLWRWRMAAYLKLVQEHGIPAIKAGTLRLSPDGDTAKMDWIENDNYYFNLFLCALNIHRELESYK